VVFTSGGSEANNLAITSAVAAAPEKRHLISSPVEHDSVLATLARLAGRGYEVEFLPVDADGMIDPADLDRAIRADTALVSLMGANNETGVVWPVAEFGRICRGRGVLYHCDAVQMAGKVELPAGACDYLSISAHKFHGPKGIGALCLGRRSPVTPLINGGAQERGRRAGTENVPAAAGMAAAARLALEQPQKERIQALRQRLEAGIKTIPGAMIVAENAPRLPNTTNVCFRHASGAGIAQELDARGIAVSTQAACHSGDIDPSHVLVAMGVNVEYSHGSLRISLSRYNHDEQIDALLSALRQAVTKASTNFVL
jgi:cysteine desulfurase